MSIHMAVAVTACCPVTIKIVLWQAFLLQVSLCNNPIGKLILSFIVGRIFYRLVQVWNLYINPRILLSKHLLTPWCRVLFEKLTGLQLVKKFPAFYGTQRLIISLTSLRHPSLSWASPIQSIYPHPTSWRSILILSTHLRLGLPSCLIHSGLPTKTLYTHLSSPIRATCPAHLIS